MTDTPLRIGVLGAARIAPLALLRPARDLAGVEVTAVAARDPRRAAAFAARHGIPAVHATYADVVADPDLDAVYVPLPNSLHAEWTLAAIAAGKHVLCEKPFTANQAEARQVAAAAAASDVVVMEAFHYRYHPLAARLREIVAAELGALHWVEASMCFPLPLFHDIRYRYDLAGGALMDAGCYAVHSVRLLAGEDPQVVGARATTLRRDPRVDRALTAELAFPSGASGRVRTSLWSWRLLSLRARVVGDRGELRVFNHTQPQPGFPHRVVIRTERGARRERVFGDTTYAHQLRAFRDAVRDGAPVLTPPDDAVVTMGIIDDIYRAAGLPVRGT